MLLCHRPIEAYNAGFSARLIRWNSPNSPFHKSHELHKHRFYQVPKKPSSRNGATTRATSDNGEYLMKLSLVKPPVDIYGLADTGSDLVWAQCAPCNDCYKQKNPMFDPQKSKTYNDMQCDSEQCNLLPGHSCSPQNLCAYGYAYADGSVTNGVLARETATFASTKGEPVVVGDILFGCGHNNKGTFNDNEMGIIGLGGGPLSLVSQIGNHFRGKRFSQCLVPFHTDPSIPGTISFGVESEV